MENKKIPKSKINIFYRRIGNNREVEGFVYLEPGQRLSDLMNNNEPFLLVTTSIENTYLLNKQTISVIGEINEEPD